MPIKERTFDSLCPADDQVVATFPVMDPTAVAEAVDRARIASHWWGELGFTERKQRLLTVAANLAARAEDLAELVHRENGKPIEDALLEIILAVDHLHWAATNARPILKRRRVRPTVLTINQASSVEYQPLGVIGVIGPWNYPVFTPMGSIGYALAAGNAVVFKPSEFTPAIGRWMIDQFTEVIPEQPVAQLLTGFGETGAALCRSGVDKISFTGSSPTGRKVMAACAERLTPVLLECGGKDAALVDQDANLEKAASAIVFGAFSNSGQTCAGLERVYAHEAVFDDLVDLVSAKATALDPGVDPQDCYGPMTMPAQIDVVRAHVTDAVRRGAATPVGGPSSIGQRLIRPIVLTDVPEDSAAVAEETFGPTVVINRVRDLDEAVDRANASDFGLGAAVFSGSPTRLKRAAARLRVGMVSGNTWLMFAGNAALPWGGVGQSGFGRIHGADGLREFSRAKSMTRERFPIPLNPASFTRHPQTTALLLRVTRLLNRR